MENTLLFALRVGDYQGIGAYAYTNANGLQALVKLQQETFDGMTSQWGSDLGGSDFVDIGSWVHYRLDLDLTTHQVTFKYANKIQVDDQPFNSTIGPGRHRGVPRRALPEQRQRAHDPPRQRDARRAVTLQRRGCARVTWSTSRTPAIAPMTAPTARVPSAGFSCPSASPIRP